MVLPTPHHEPREKQQAWREFYYRWVKSTTYLSDIPADLPEEVAAVRIDKRHWNLLEANLAVALKLYAQGVEKARTGARSTGPLWAMSRPPITRIRSMPWNKHLQDTNSASLDCQHGEIMDHGRVVVEEDALFKSAL